ncbi:3-deoxy-7-phosphoheptulonate synthase [Lentzea sp. DG1S-22]|uniref:3-deoxy-7-phosphoheptulonate synthase n=1 Tax=Lentzea sp. DG1S-22 TaxID=3108822 RepID=UPI002E76379A|nr:3-deoxy-7-phosphoheptulonate synthase [Lentzea sp. DG1S-22]WVH82412.1 3-deoxy-7-phosphoheptulonate synthase [Lentzea sp. DG1S-22]
MSTRSSPRYVDDRIDRALVRPAAQQPSWPDPARVAAVRVRLGKALPISLPGEIDRLRRELALVATRRAFVAQGGDCAESFTATDSQVAGTLRTLLGMASVLTGRTGAPVVTIGRIAGQYAKPRSSDVDEQGLPVYRGDIVNTFAADAGGRVPDPDRMLHAHARSSATMSLVRRVGSVFASHEMLLLDYESSLLRPYRGDDRERRWYAGSGHFLWIGERTRALDGAHVALAELLANPIGVKIGPATTPEQAAEYVERLDPRHEPGRLTLITRLGHARVRDLLPAILEKVEATGRQVVWQCDPMHGNTEQVRGWKVRRFDRIHDEVRGFLEVHHALGSHPGGVHLELTGEDTTECLGGRSRPVDERDVSRRYESMCDPRLNGTQALELAALIADEMVA